jgi:hypothetical protein
MMMSWIFSLIMLMNGGGNELLDFVPTDAYWKSHNVEVSVEALTKDLQADVAADPAKPKAGAVRRLMAIRALGEMKKPAAVKALKPFLTSKEPFEAEYAAEAIAAIENKVVAGIGPVRDSMGDIWLMPANVGVVGQLKFSAATPESIQKQITEAPLPPELNRAQMTAQFHEFLIAQADQIGNVRIDAVSFSISEQIDDQIGFVIAVIRGTYDSKAVEALIAKSQVPSQATDGVTVYKLDKEAALILPSNDRLVLIFGPNEQSLPVKEIAATLKSGKGKLPESTDMVKLIESMNSQQILWAVAKMSDSYHKAPLLAPFDIMKLKGEMKDGLTQVSLEAKGSDPAAIQKLVTQSDQQLNSAIEDARQFIDKMPAMKPMLEMMESIQMKADGGTVTVTAEIKGAPLGMVMASLFGVRTANRAPDAPPAPARMEINEGR